MLERLHIKQAPTLCELIRISNSCLNRLAVDSDGLCFALILSLFYVYNFLKPFLIQLKPCIYSISGKGTPLL